MIFRW